MSADIIDFFSCKVMHQSRRARFLPLPGRPRACISVWQDRSGCWVIDHQSAFGDSAGILESNIFWEDEARRRARLIALRTNCDFDERPTHGGAA